MITGMNHTGFVVRDVEASAEFYMNVIGLKEVARRERKGSSSIPGRSFVKCYYVLRINTGR